MVSFGMMRRDRKSLLKGGRKPSIYPRSGTVKVPHSVSHSGPESGSGSGRQAGRQAARASTQVHAACVCPSCHRKHQCPSSSPTLFTCPAKRLTKTTPCMCVCVCVCCPFFPPPKSGQTHSEAETRTAASCFAACCFAGLRWGTNFSDSHRLERPAIDC